MAESIEHSVSAAMKTLRRFNTLRGPKAWLFILGGTMLGSSLGSGVAQLLFHNRRPDAVVVAFACIGLLLLAGVCFSEFWQRRHARA